MKKIIFIVSLWIAIIYLLKQFHLLSLDMGVLKEFISGNTKYTILLFLALWIIRLLLLIPGATLMLLGGICFNPILGIILSMVGIVLSETLVYIISRIFSSKKIKQNLESKYPKLKTLLENYNYKFLALGIICPIAPSDAICFLAAAVGIKYSTYMLTIIISNIPLMIVYSLIGISLSDSLMGTVIVILSFALIAFVSIKIWNNLKQMQKI
ncbi:TVP38/TMEM64 family protein [Heyndrickxia vini]|uniref:TVP38/TMEM64 family membrane protein n=1 Tax=Heyndrickxia vini TaxID=1476025 RepID=A0ABX7DYF4_9BACI|nr:VTT domain-containing protein [Heyndrickxia vini]QQZ08476.1 VTT domain-containing protein [Heyndrickxia vini]